MDIGAPTDTSISDRTPATRIIDGQTIPISVATAAMDTSGENGAVSCARAMDTGCRITIARIEAPMAKAIIVARARVSIPHTGHLVRATIIADHIGATAM